MSVAVKAKLSNGSSLYITNIKSTILLTHVSCNSKAKIRQVVQTSTQPRCVEGVNALLIQRAAPRSGNFTEEVVGISDR